MNNREMTRTNSSQNRWTPNHLNIYSVSLIIREMQLKNTMKYPLTSVRMTKINNIGNHKCQQDCREK